MNNVEDEIAKTQNLIEQYERGIKSHKILIEKRKQGLNDLQKGLEQLTKSKEKHEVKLKKLKKENEISDSKRID